MSDTANRPGGESDARKMMVSMAGAGANEHDVQPPGADSLALKAGHEPDRFSARAILYVPAVVVIALIVAYVLVQSVFSLLVNKGYTGAVTNPQVVSVNDRPINDRFARISSTEPKPIAPEKPDTKVAQPRLEYLRQQGDAQSPDYERSKRSYQAGNSPEIYPESLRAQNYIDPATGEKVLLKAELLGDKTVARIPIADAIGLAAAGTLKLPVRKDPVKLPATSDGTAKISNGGRPTASKAPAAKHEDHDHKH